jgi:hypothetical protein
MAGCAKEKRLILTITLLPESSYRKGRRMIAIGSIPRKLQPFFRVVHKHFSRPAWDHFWGLVLAITVAHGSTIDRLTRLLRGSTHRTKHGEFLWHSEFDHVGVLQEIALDTLRRLRQKNGGKCYFIVDETQTLKRARKMQGVGTLFHHATGQYGRGHTMLKVCLWYRGVTIPWGTWLYLKQDDARKLGMPFCKLTELAALAILNAPLPSGLDVTVLFDCYYLCPVVVNACASRGWHYIGAGKGNRNFTVEGRARKLEGYGRNVLDRSGQWCRIEGLRKEGSYCLAERTGNLRHLGPVKVVFSRRRNDWKPVSLVTDDQGATMRSIVADYLKRWAIELLIKDQKQQLGLGDYRVKRYRAVVRHLHLVELAYACLTHLALKGPGAQGRKSKGVLRLPAISELKTRMRQIVWQEAVEDVVRHSHEKPVVRRLERLLAA